MTITPAKLLRGLALLCILVAWAFLAHHGSAAESHPDFSAALATAPIASPLSSCSSGASPTRCGWYWAALPCLRCSPGWPGRSCGRMSRCFITSSIVGTNLALGTLFGRTLIGERQALVTQFALMAHHGVISPAKARYTRQVTIAWTAFFLLTATVSTVLFWLPLPTAWSIFANLLTIPLIGLMFMAEHIVRHRVLAPDDCSSIADTIRGYRAAMQQSSDPLAKRP
jgi:uncharacterized membrane protein